MQTIQFLRRDGVFRKTVLHAWEPGALKTLCGHIVPTILYRMERDADCLPCLRILARRVRYKVPRKSLQEITEEQVKAAVRVFEDRGGIIKQHAIDPRLNEVGRIGKVLMMHPQNKIGTG